MTRALLGLGSNVGDRRAHLAGAIEGLRASDGERLAVTALSDVYETDPVGGPDGQPAFLNLVVAVETTMSAHELLGVCHRLETAAGRVRGERWGPRTLDVDVLWIEGVELDTPDLQVPHPRMRGRRFVMAPLAEIAPDVAGDDWDLVADGQVTRLGPLDTI